MAFIFCGFIYRLWLECPALSQTFLDAIDRESCMDILLFVKKDDRGSITKTKDTKLHGYC